MGGELDRHGPRQRGDRRLGGAIVGIADLAGEGDRRDIDDLAVLPLDHRWRQQLRQMQDAFGVECESRVPALFRHCDHRLEQRLRLDATDDIDDDVDMTKRRVRCRNYSGSLCRLCNVGALGDQLGSGGE